MKYIFYYSQNKSNKIKSACSIYFDTGGVFKCVEDVRTTITFLFVFLFLEFDQDGLVEYHLQHRQEC